MAIISLACLLFEIMYAQHSRKKIIPSVTPLSMEYKYSYTSKFGDLKTMRKHVYMLLHDLSDTGLEIVHSEVSVVPSATNFEMSILLLFQRNTPEELSVIVAKFDAFTVYLDNTS